MSSAHSAGLSRGEQATDPFGDEIGLLFERSLWPEKTCENSRWPEQSVLTAKTPLIFMISLFAARAIDGDGESLRIVGDADRSTCRHSRSPRRAFGRNDVGRSAE